MTHDRDPDDLMRRMGQSKPVLFDLLSINLAGLLKKAVAEDDPVPLLYSAEWLRWVDGKYLGDDYLKPSPTNTEPPLPCIWEGRPAYWTPAEAWAFIDRAWERVNSGDVGMNARPVTASALAETFPDTPPLPAEAFKASRKGRHGQSM